MRDEVTDYVGNVLKRWETLGLLDGLPINSRIELSQVYDNATKLLLAELTLKKVPKKVSDTMNEVFIPICRRLYKRVGINFDLEGMMSKLLEVVSKELHSITQINPQELEKNPMIEFCVNFADNYEDEIITKNTLTNEEYENKITQLILKIQEVLLNERMVAYVDRVENDFILNYSKTEKTHQQTRFWNQSVAKQLFNSVIDEINK